MFCALSSCFWLLTLTLRLSDGKYNNTRGVTITISGAKEARYNMIPFFVEKPRKNKSEFAIIGANHGGGRGGRVGGMQGGMERGKERGRK